MRSLSRFLPSIGLAVVVVTMALAQNVKLRLPADFQQIHLLRNDSVQKELKLTPAQVEKLREIFTHNQESTRDIWQKTPPEEIGPFFQDLAKQLREDTLAVLTGDQRDRFWQIDFQNQRNMNFDSFTFQRHDLLKKLEFTREQQQKLQAINAETTKKNQAAFNPPNMFQQKVAALRKEDREQVAELLTAEQKKSWDELTGKPFVVVNVNPNADLQTALRKWIRDDFARAQAESRKTGKPIFALFRCEP
jgi:Spy/CpxP family protein refolding chaperone